MGTRFWTMQERTPITGLGKALLFFVLALLLIWLCTGCANVTVVKLAELCHTNSGHPSVTFAGESGKVDCRG